MLRLIIYQYYCYYYYYALQADWLRRVLNLKLWRILRDTRSVAAALVASTLVYPVQVVFHYPFMSEDAQSTWRSAFKLSLTTHLVLGCVQPIRLTTSHRSYERDSGIGHFHMQIGSPCHHHQSRHYPSSFARCTKDVNVICATSTISSRSIPS